MDPKDQVDGQDGTESEEETEETGKTEETEKTEDNQEDSDKEQSDKGSEQELFELPDGRKVNAQDLSKEWKENFMPEFTKRSQRISQLEKAEKEREAKAESNVREAVNKSELLKDVPPGVKEAVLAIVKPLIQDSLKQRDTDDAQQRADDTFRKELEGLEKEFPGGDGKPKFDRNLVLKEMQADGNRIFDPKQMFEKMHAKDFNDLLVKQALKKQRGGTSTEDTSREGPTKPDKKTPKTFEEARRAAISRFANKE